MPVNLPAFSDSEENLEWEIINPFQIFLFIQFKRTKKNDI